MKEPVKNITQTIDEVPFPANVKLEQQVLADALASPESLDDMFAVLPVEAFTGPARQGLWKTIKELWQAGIRPDGTTLLNRCNDDFINEIVAPSGNGLQGIPFRREALHHAAELRAVYARSCAYAAAVEILMSTADPTLTEADLCAKADSLSAAIQNSGAATTVLPLSGALDTLRASMEERAALAAAGKAYRAPTGLPTLDYLLYGGLEPGNLVILAARPSQGKTAMLIYIAGAAARAGFPVTIFSLEQTAEELAQRYVQGTDRNISPLDIANGRITADFEAAVEELRDLPIFLDQTSRRIEDVVATMTRQVRQGRCRVAFIDYLGLMAAAMPGRDPLNQRIGAITAELKAVAKRLKIPVVLLCQQNRDSVKENRPPELFDLRDSGSIEQDADVVLMLDSSKEIDADTSRHNLLVWVRKNRKFLKDKCIECRPNRTFTSFTEVGVHDSVVDEDLPAVE